MTGIAILCNKLLPQSLCAKLSLISNNLDPVILRNFGIGGSQGQSILKFSSIITSCYNLVQEGIQVSIMGKTKGGFYAVARGKQVGVYLTWEDCKSQVDGFGNARYKKFGSQAEAEQFIRDNGGATVTSSNFSKTLSTTVDGGVKKAKSVVRTPIPSNHIPKSSYTVCVPPSAQFQLPTPSRLQQTRTAILINPLARQNPNSTTTTGGDRGICTSAKLDKRGLRVTEDRVTGAQSGLKKANPGVDLSAFQVDEEGYIVVFTDGACTKNGRKGAEAGIGVWFGDDHNLNISEPVLGRQTNNTAEIQAAERAIIQAKNAGITKLKLKTDSQFTINCVTMWLNKWKHNNWKLGTGQDVKNREDLEKLDKAMSGVEIKWSYVPGHRGHYGNEMADRLAVAGAKKSRN